MCLMLDTSEIERKHLARNVTCYSDINQDKSEKKEENITYKWKLKQSGNSNTHIRQNRL